MDPPPYGPLEGVEYPPEEVTFTPSSTSLDAPQNYVSTPEKTLFHLMFPGTEQLRTKRLEKKKESETFVLNLMHLVNRHAREVTRSRMWNGVKSKYSACRKQFSRSSNLTLLLFLTGVVGGKMCDDTDEAANALKLIKGGSEATQRHSKI